MHAYLQLVIDRFDCYGTWLPGTRIAVGEIGRMVGGGSFERTGDLKERLQQPQPPVIRVKEPQIQAVTGATASRSAGIEVKSSQILQAVASAAGSVRMKMAMNNSAALLLEEVTRKQFSDEQTIRALMEAMLARGLLEREEVVVTYILEAESGIVAASSNRESSVEAGVDVAFTEFELAKVEGRLAVVSGQTSDTIVEARKGRSLTPMYRVLFFRGSSHWWTFWKKEYTVDALIRGAASLREYQRRSGGRFRRSTAPGFGTGLGLMGPPGPEASMVVADSRPSIALTEQSLAELSEAGLETEPFISLLTPQLSPSTPTLYYREPAMADVYTSLGRVLEGQGDLRGAQEQYELALRWSQHERAGALPHEAAAKVFEVEEAIPTVPEAVEELEVDESET